MTVKDYIYELSHALKQIPVDSIELAIDEIGKVVQNGNAIFTCGNGGSALTASHFVTDWSKMSWTNKGKPFRAYCLSDNIGMLTAYSNDISYADVFAENLKNYASPGDMLIVVSGSGNSENVIRAIDAAKKLSIRTIALSGFDGGKVNHLADTSVHVPIHDMQIVEDLHLSFGHMVMKSLCL